MSAILLRHTTLACVVALVPFACSSSETDDDGASHQSVGEDEADDARDADEDQSSGGSAGDAGVGADDGEQGPRDRNAVDGGALVGGDDDEEAVVAPVIDVDEEIIIDPADSEEAVVSDAGVVCASESAAAELEPVVLAFLFDVSGSMGQGDVPWHDRALKWDPVVAATKAFFSDPESTGLSASLTFFPASAGDICVLDSYVDPDVPLTALPSDDFSMAIDAATPETFDDWLGGTPTWAALEGTYEFLQDSLSNNPAAHHAVVLVSDGEPSACGEDRNDIEAIADFVQGYSDEASTYVIGVSNPATDEEPDPPDTVVNLSLIAEHGGTESAFLIDTGNPEQTASDFAAVVDAIRGNTLSCTITIPPPPSDEMLDKDLVNVTYSTEDADFLLAYSQDCSQQDAWFYDDPDDPTTIELCASTCDAVLAEPSASLEVEFGCVQRAEPRRLVR